jgi:hypothetical protein
MSPRFTICFIALATTFTCFADDQPQPDAKERSAIDQAAATYDEDVGRAKSAYDEAIARAGKKLLAAYDLVIAAAMKRGGGEALDLANKLNDEKKVKASLIELGELKKDLAKNEPPNKKGEPAKKKGKPTEQRQPFAGVWLVKYVPNRTARTYVIRPSGQVEYEGRMLPLNPAGESLLLDFGDKLERLTFSGGRLFVEHFSSKAGFASNEPDQVGIGELAKSN